MEQRLTQTGVHCHPHQRRYHELKFDVRSRWNLVADVDVGSYVHSGLAASFLFFQYRPHGVQIFLLFVSTISPLRTVSSSIK